MEPASIAPKREVTESVQWKVRADDALAEGDKYTQYGKEYVGLNADSSPALAILAMERHGSFSKGSGHS